MNLHPKSDAIIDTKTGEVLIYSELLKGNRVLMPSGYRMSPQSGTLLSKDGARIDLVELLLNAGSGSTGGGGTAPSTISWNNVTGKPRLANELALTSTTLELKDTNNTVINSIDLLSIQEVQDLLNTL